MRLSLLAVGLLFLCSCDDGRWAPGYLITNEGETVSNTDVNKRALTIRTITTQLDQQLGGHWRSETTIAELPKYSSGSDLDSSAWMWPKATVTVTLIGDGMGESALTNDQVTAAVRDYLFRQVEKPQRNLSVTTTRVVDATRFAAKSQPAATGAQDPVNKPATTVPNGEKRYIVQAGDTWADLSQAFYGTTQHWRHIADANHQVELTPGREIVIPVKP